MITIPLIHLPTSVSPDSTSLPSGAMLGPRPMGATNLQQSGAEPLVRQPHSSHIYSTLTHNAMTCISSRSCPCCQNWRSSTLVLMTLTDLGRSSSPHSKQRRRQGGTHRQ